MTDTSTPPSAKLAAKRRGRNDMPPQQWCHARPGRRIKRDTQDWTRYLGRKLTAAERGAVAYVCMSL